MSAIYKFSKEGTNKQTVPLLSMDSGKEAKVSTADYTHLKQEYLLLVERVNGLEVENSNLRMTVQFYRDICLDDECAYF